MSQPVDIHCSRKANYLFLALFPLALLCSLLPIATLYQLVGLLLWAMLMTQAWRQTLGLGLTGSIRFTDEKCELLWNGQCADIQAFETGFLREQFICAAIRLPDRRVHLLVFNDAITTPDFWRLRRFVGQQRWRQSAV